MRILVANHTARVAGGAEQYVHGIARVLRERGHAVRLLVEDVSVNASDGWSTKTGVAWREEVPRWRPDVAFVHGLFSSELESWLVNAFPSVLFAHNFYGTCISGAKCHTRPTLQPCSRRFGEACLWLYYPRGCGRSSPLGMLRGYREQRARNTLLAGYRSIVVASSFMGREFMRHVSIPVEVVPLFVATPVKGSSPRTATQFVFVGRLTEEKGPADLLSAIERLRERGLELEVTFVGDGPQRDELFRRARKVPGVRFVGWVAPAERDALVAGACAIVIPSRWPEPFGLVGLEAARLGVPAVAFETGGIGEWLVDGENGALIGSEVPRIDGLASGILRALEDRSGPNTWSRRALEAAARFDEATHVQRLEAVLSAAATHR
jgi:glycosyltransferase involved in cell wall biosynthesis